jgi:hypothetical protein
MAVLSVVAEIEVKIRNYGDFGVIFVNYLQNCPKK